MTSWNTEAHATVHEDNLKPKFALVASNSDGVDVLQKPRSFIAELNTHSTLVRKLNGESSGWWSS